MSMQTCMYFIHMCVHLYIILLSLLSHSTLVNAIGCYKGELPETFSIQVDMRRLVFYVCSPAFQASLVEVGGKAIWHYIRH